MADIDRQKEWIATWRMIFIFLLGSLFGLFAFLFNNFDKLSDNRLILLNVAAFLLLLGIIYSVRKLYIEINKLKDM